MAAAVRHGDPILATKVEDVGASGESLAVPGQVELDPGATPQARRQVVGTATTNPSKGANEDEF